MASDARDLLEEAMQLAPGARGAMAAELIRSLDQDLPAEAVAQLQATIARAQEG